MVSNNEPTCPVCGGNLKYYDSVLRITRTKYRKTNRIKIRRLRCNMCNGLHRELPDSMLKNKQYEVEVIIGVLEGLITSDTLGFEEYPCSMTMSRWFAQFTSPITRNS